MTDENQRQQTRNTAHAALIAETDETAGLRGEVERLRKALTVRVFEIARCHGCTHFGCGKGTYFPATCEVLDGETDKLCPIVEALRDGE